MNPDQDLHARFQALRQVDRMDSPVWNEDLMVASKGRATEHDAPGRLWSPWRIVWMPVGAAVLTTGLFLALQQPRQESLSEVLPVLLDAPAKPMFASLESDSTSPSDFLLPDRLTFQMP